MAALCCAAAGGGVAACEVQNGIKMTDDNRQMHSTHKLMSLGVLER